MERWAHSEQHLPQDETTNAPDPDQYLAMRVEGWAERNRGLSATTFYG